MGSLIQRIESAGNTRSIESARARERSLSRLLIAYISVGLGFMLLPGTFLGVLNLFRISEHTGPTISAAWIQAHGHAQVFGWVGSFILGIGFYSIPKLRKQDAFAISSAATCLVLWTAGVGLRWWANIYGSEWRILLPTSALLELVAFSIFVRSVSGHKPESTPGGKSAFEPWIFIVMAGTLGLLAALLMNLAGCISVALHGASPAFPHRFDMAFLAICAWGFLVPFVWGFSAKWLLIFLGLKPPRTRGLLAMVGANAIALVLAWFNPVIAALVFLATAACAAIFGLRLFERPQSAPKVRGVHPSYPLFIRMAYVWLIVASALGVWSAFGDPAGGLGGASRHALTVGFVATMVFSIGQRVLPAFSGMRMLFSTRLMLADLLLLNAGCTLRVAGEVLAYPGYWPPAWTILPISAVIELTAVTMFTINMVATFASALPHYADAIHAQE